MTPPDLIASPRRWRPLLPYALVLTAGAFLLGAPWAGHIDDIDAQLYRVLVRHMLADHRWLQLRFVPGYLDPFYEHLPFGFWPATAVSRVFGAGAIDPLALLFSLAALAIVMRAAAKLDGLACGIGAGLLLATNEIYWHYGARLLLEPFLFPFATAAAALLIRKDAGRREWLLAAGLAAVAALVKGPFGLAPLACFGAARSILLVSPRQAAWTALSLLLATLPAALFLGLDRTVLHLGWWQGYVENQLLASASGSRSDGWTLWWLPFKVVLGRFWPGLPFVLLAAARVFKDGDARRRLEGRILVLGCFLLLCALCLPSRKWGNHTYVAFPLLAISAGYGASWIFSGVLAKRRNMRRAGFALVGVTLVCVAFAVLGVGRNVLRPPCALQSGLAAPLASLPAGDVLVISAPMDVSMVASVAEETARVTRPLDSLPPVAPAGTSAALVRTEKIAGSAGWRTAGEARGWTLLGAAP